MTPFIRISALLLCTAIAPGVAAATYEDKYLDANGVKIRYIDAGKGEAIVLLHGGTSRLESWVTPGVFDNLSKDFRVIAFDARGHGKSDSPREPASSMAVRSTRRTHGRSSMGRTSMGA
jgi:pimeloyl-ACP methyl ester carboxylesterase